MTGISYAISLTLKAVSEPATHKKIRASYKMASCVAESASAKPSRITMTTDVCNVQTADATALANEKPGAPPEH
ncbi:hypothetical protein MMJ09_22170, partial [Bacillus vallismortis]|nr:hypothetical protein [Bacillus vallismortis]